MAVLLQEWESCREQRFRSPPRYQGEKFYPCWGEAWVKAAVLGLGSTFRLQEDGTFARTLHPWLLQVPGPVTNINVFGKTQHVASWAILPGAVIGEKHGEIMHISLVGNVTSLRAFHAAFMDSKRSVFSFPRYGNYGSAITAQREKGSSRYLTVFNDEELPKSGMAHLDISHISITKPPFAESFIHLVGNVKDAPPDLLLFFRQLNAAISIAVREEWSQKLWDYGISYRLIQSIPSMGCTAWVVWPNEQKWGRIVSALVLGKDPEDVYDETLFEAVGNASPDDDMDMVIEDEEQDDNEED